MMLESGLDLVRQLSARLDGEDVADAALAFGLLISRERVGPYFGPDRDEEIQRMFRVMFGGALAVQRLAPLAVHEALQALLAHIERVDVPIPAVIWALTRGFDPRVVPRLAALLERIVDDPEHAHTAHQIVEGLKCFGFDPRAVAGLELAAARGHADVKGIADVKGVAEQWISLHGGRERPPREASVHTPAFTSRLDGDAYRLQRRPRHRELVSNDGGRALLRLSLDPAGWREPVRVPISPGFPPDHSVHAWCFRDDGARAVVFSERGAGTWLSFEGEPARDVAAPAFTTGHPEERYDDVRYVWEGERLIVTGGSISNFWDLRDEGGQLRFEKLVSIYVRRDATAWRTAEDALSALTARVLRTEPDEARILAYDYRTPPGQLVALCWRDDARTLRVPAPAYVPQLACDGARFYLLYDHEVQAVDAAGHITDIFLAPDGTYLRALETLPATGGEPAILAVIAAPLAGGGPSQLLGFHLAPP